VRSSEFDVLWRSRGCSLPASDDKDRSGTESSIDSETGLAGGEDMDVGAVSVLARSTEIVGGAFRCVVRRVRYGLVKRKVILLCSTEVNGCNFDT
jgi:hypothetical protein